MRLVIELHTDEEQDLVKRARKQAKKDGYVSLRDLMIVLMRAYTRDDVGTVQEGDKIKKMRQPKKPVSPRRTIVEPQKEEKPVAEPQKPVKEDISATTTSKSPFTFLKTRI